MTKKEVHVLAALIVVIAAGLAVRAWKEKHDAGAYILVEQGRPSSYRQHQPDSQSPPFAYSSEVPSKASSSQQQMYGADGRLDLNRADAVALDGLPRIGPSRAEDILAWRRQNGPFTTTGDLLKIRGIGEKTHALLEPLIFVEAPATDFAVSTASDSANFEQEDNYTQPSDLKTASAQTDEGKPDEPPHSEDTETSKINLNSADQGQLEKLWNIGPVKARAIIEWRQTNGPFQKVDQLEKVPGIGPATLQRNRDRLSCQ